MNSLVSKVPLSVTAFSFVSVIVWGVVFWDAIYTAANIWYVSEIFTHGFFIIPGALYFIWAERERLASAHVSSNFAVLGLILPVLLLGVIGAVGDIRVFQHFSAFTVLPLMIWMVVGNQVAKIIWFPLCFMLFSIPVGEELVPTLQRITTDIAVFLLGFTSIPFINTGLYIEIPQGKFVVAEACSGIRFFIGSLVFGAVYAHISYRTLRAKILFMLLALVVPVVANALRVYGIVLIGYYSDMEHATGADHLVYGWVFFSIVLLLLFLVGERFRQVGSDEESTDKQGSLDFLIDTNKVLLSLSVIVLALGGAKVWQSVAVDSAQVVKSLDKDALRAVAYEAGNAWKPSFQDADDVFHGRFSDASDVDLFVGLYLGEPSVAGKAAGELVSVKNRLFDIDKWSLNKKSKVEVSLGEISVALGVNQISGIDGQFRHVVYWYVLEGRVSSNRIVVKLMQTWNLLTGGDDVGTVFVVSAAYEGHNKEERLAYLFKQIENKGDKLLISLPYPAN